MNNKIFTTLVDEADTYALEHVQAISQQGYLVEHDEYDRTFRKRFAELIVRRCAGLFEDDGSCTSMTEYIGNTRAKESILKYFELNDGE